MDETARTIRANVSVNLLRKKKIGLPNFLSGWHAFPPLGTSVFNLDSVRRLASTQHTQRLHQWSISIAAATSRKRNCI
jgi:hypothetical protein